MKKEKDRFNVCALELSDCRSYERESSRSQNETDPPPFDLHLTIERGEQGRRQNLMLPGACPKRKRI